MFPHRLRITEAVHFLKIPLDQIDVLSVGTTSPPFNIAEHAKSGIAQWNVGLVNLMFQAQMETAVSQSQLLLDGNLYRIDVVAHDGDFSLDSASPEKISRLINLGDLEGKRKDHLIQVRKHLLCSPAISPFVPLYRS